MESYDIREIRKLVQTKKEKSDPDLNKSTDTNSLVQEEESSGGGSDSSSPGVVWADPDESINSKCSTLKRELVQNETTVVTRLRWAVIIILVLATAAISVAIYAVRKDAETTEFQSQYTAAAEKIIES